MMAYIVFGAIGMLTLALLALLGPATIMLILLAITLCVFGTAMTSYPIFFVLIAFSIIIWVMVMWGSK